MRRLLAGLAIVVGLGMAHGDPAFAGTGTSAPEDFGGVNAQWVFWAPQPTWAAHLDAMAAGGIRNVRSDATWNSVEPAPPVLNNHLFFWSSFDSIVTALAKRSMRWQPVLGYSALWASSVTAEEHAPPADPATYAAYVSAFAARYGAGGAFWKAHPELTARPVRTYEIWNEENLSGYWKPVANPAGYANLYAAARLAIKAVDPAGVVMVGGLNSGNDPPKYVEAMLAARPDLQGKLDAVALHPYAADADAALKVVVRLRRGLEFLGSGDAPIVANEFGWTTGGSQAKTDAWRAGQLATLTRDLARSDCGVTAVDPYTWTTLGLTVVNAEDGYAMVSQTGAQSATATAYLGAIRDVADGKVGAPGTLKACWPDAAPPPPGTGGETTTPIPTAPTPVPSESTSPAPSAPPAVAPATGEAAPEGPQSAPPPAPAATPPASTPAAPTSRPSTSCKRTKTKRKTKTKHKARSAKKKKAKKKAKSCAKKPKKRKAKRKHR